MSCLLHQLEAGHSVLGTERPIRVDDTDHVDAHRATEPDGVRLRPPIADIANLRATARTRAGCDAR
jgi:hypothetical protein